jgi:hypothetical protein
VALRVSLLFVMPEFKFKDGDEMPNDGVLEWWKCKVLRLDIHAFSKTLINAVA